MSGQSCPIPKTYYEVIIENKEYIEKTASTSTVNWTQIFYNLIITAENKSYIQGMKVKLTQDHPSINSENDISLKEKMMGEIIHSLEAMKPVIKYEIESMGDKNENKKKEMINETENAITYIQDYARGISPGAYRSFWNLVPNPPTSGGKKKTRRRKKSKRKRKSRRARR